MEKEKLEKIKEQVSQKPKPTEQKANLSQTGKKRLLNKKILIIIGIIIVMAGATVLFRDAIFKKAPKQIYEVAIMVRSQRSNDPNEDARSSLKAGDVLLVQAEGHSWSQTEKISYLILKMNLTEEQASKLTQPKEKEVKFKDLSEEEQERIEEEKKRAEEEGREYMEEPRTETILARQYRIKMEKFEGFKPADLLSGQPFEDEIFTWSIVEKKPKMDK